MKKFILKFVSCPYKDMNGKWWHRLLKVLFIFSILIVFLSSLAINYDELEYSPRTFFTNKISLNEFTRKYNGADVNTIPLFKKEKGKLGCITDGTIKYLWNDIIGRCYKDPEKHITEIISSYGTEFTSLYNRELYDSEKAKLKKYINENISIIDDTGKPRVCFMANSTKCNSINTVKYQLNLLFYLYVLLWGIIITAIYSSLVYLFYTKVFLYIIYGNKK